MSSSTGMGQSINQAAERVQFRKKADATPLTKVGRISGLRTIEPVRMEQREIHGQLVTVKIYTAEQHVLEVGKQKEFTHSLLMAKHLLRREDKLRGRYDPCYIDGENVDFNYTEYP